MLTCRTRQNPPVKGGFLVEVTRFELTTSWSRTKRATKLRYTSKLAEFAASLNIIRY